MCKHITNKNENLFCSNCGSKYAINFPLPIPEMNKKIDAFTELHKDCELTYQEEKPNLTDSYIDKAHWWLHHGERGNSSNAMYGCFMNVDGMGINHPYDPDDFKRCYKLLEAVPEFKKQMYKLELLSPTWQKLVQNWDKLTEMYEQNVRENWANYKQVGMYEFMKLLRQD